MFKPAGPAGRQKAPSTLSAVICTLALALCVLGGSVGDAAARNKHAVIVVDAKTGRTIHASDANALRYPASLTKMMTLYLTFEALASGKITMNTPVPVSRHAAAQEPSKLYLKPGQSIPVKTAILAIVTRSANDVATAVGEMLGGTETNFARLMTKKAHALGMSRTTYKNANGLPAHGQMVTARDMATLGIALREHFPQYYHFFSVESFNYHGHRIRNHDHLIGSVGGVDGIKTGYTYASGFNLVTSIRKNGRSVVAVVMGGRSWRSRDNEMRRLLIKYVPRASTSGPGDLVAETRPAATLAGIQLPVHGPRPQFRESANARVALAFAEETPSGAFPRPVPRPVVGASAQSETLQQQADIARPKSSNADVGLAFAKAAPSDAFPRPAPRPVIGRSALIKTLQQQQAAVARPRARVEAAATTPTPPVSVGDANVDGLTTSSTSSVRTSGWVIQIGAAPDQSSAVKLLDKAKTSNSRLLASARPFTTTTNNGGQRVYRARFSGFDGKDDAWTACADLKKHGYGCWATRQ